MMTSFSPSGTSLLDYEESGLPEVLSVDEGYYLLTTGRRLADGSVLVRLEFFPWKGGTLSWNGKYVGKQYLDNSMREDLVVPAYFVSGASISQKWGLGMGNLEIALYANNLFNRMYYAAGWRWEAYNADSGQVYYGMGVYPQAPLNLMLKMRYSF